MNIPNNHVFVEGDRVEEINTPYDLVNDIDENSHSDLSILSSWVEHMKSKAVPYYVTQCKNKLVLFVERSSKTWV